VVNIATRPAAASPADRDHRRSNRTAKPSRQSSGRTVTTTITTGSRKTIAIDCRWSGIGRGGNVAKKVQRGRPTNQRAQRRSTSRVGIDLERPARCRRSTECGGTNLENEYKRSDPIGKIAFTSLCTGQRDPRVPWAETAKIRKGNLVLCEAMHSHMKNHQPRP